MTPGRPAPPGFAPGPAVRGGAGGAVSTRSTLLAEQRIPQAVVVTHGVFAVATVVLVLLAALNVGGS